MSGGCRQHVFLWNFRLTKGVNWPITVVGRAVARFKRRRPVGTFREGEFHSPGFIRQHQNGGGYPEGIIWDMDAIVAICVPLAGNEGKMPWIGLAAAFDPVRERQDMLKRPITSAKRYIDPHTRIVPGMSRTRLSAAATSGTATARSPIPRATSAGWRVRPGQ